MNLTACTNCGVVLDANHLDFPDNIYDGHGRVDHDKAVWDGNDYVPYVKCPVCQSIVEEP